MAQDILTAGTGTGVPGGTAEVPLFVRDRSGTPLGGDSGAGSRIQGIAVKISCSPAAAVTGLAIVRSGATQALTPLYETAPTSAGAIGWLVSFAEATNPVPLALDAADPGNRVATLQVTISGSATPGTVIALTIDTAASALSNQTGTVVETTAGGSLSVVPGSVTVLAPTTVVLSSSPNPSTPGEMVTLTAAVSSGTPGTISGTVAFKDGGAAIGTAPLSAGQSVLSTTALPAGLHSLTAEYNGDANFATSTSPVVQHSVAPRPTGVNAVAISTSSVVVTWNALGGVDHFEIFRSSGGAPFTPAGTNTLPAFNDAAVSPGTTYLYYVRAVMTDGATSPSSAIDPATTIMFTDDPLQANETIIKGVHVQELRAAVNAFRVSAGLAATLPGGSPADTLVAASHVNDLRTALAEARAQLGLPATPYAQPVITPGSTFVKTNDVQELREAVK